MPPAVARPKYLTSPGFLWIAPLGTAAPTNAATASKFSDSVAAAWLPLGATTEGTTFGYSSSIEPITAAEFLDPIAYETVSRAGSMAFALMSYTLSNLRRAMNGGVAALTPTGTGGSELTTFEPPTPGAEVRAMLLWESTDATVRIMLRQAIQGGELSSTFAKAPATAAIPCTFNMEVPASGAQPFTVWGAGADRV